MATSTTSGISTSNSGSGFWQQQLGGYGSSHPGMNMERRIIIIETQLAEILDIARRIEPFIEAYEALKIDEEAHDGQET